MKKRLALIALMAAFLSGCANTADDWGVNNMVGTKITATIARSLNTTDLEVCERGFGFTEQGHTYAADSAVCSSELKARNHA